MADTANPINTPVRSLFLKQSLRDSAVILRRAMTIRNVNGMSTSISCDFAIWKVLTARRRRQDTGYSTSKGFSRKIDDRYCSDAENRVDKPPCIVKRRLIDDIESVELRG